MKDIVVMYHYVREPKSWNGSVPISIEDFKKQVMWLNERYEIVSPKNLNKETQKPKCIISFDDATKDQYTNAYSILKELGIPGYFTVMSAPLQEGIVPIFHLVHTVLSHYTDEEVWNELNQLFDIPDLSDKSGYYNYESNLFRRYNKYVFNFLLAEQECRTYLESKVVAVYGSLEQFVNEFYISIDEFKEMHENGMTLGVHCHKHLPYKGDAQRFYNLEIAPCKEFMEKELGIDVKWYTPAFGGGENAKSMLNDLEPILKENGFKNAFTTVESYTDLSGYNFWINRFDCNRPYFLSTVLE